MVNTWFNHVRRKLGFTYWSLSAYLKHRVKNAVEYIGDYEKALADEARRREVDGVICGHIHSAEIRPMEGVLYCNDGDWVERTSGERRIIDWVASRRLPPARAAA
jgi:UDP-2,3-diacylglucosamine pyrophosphatase LpxH